MEQSSAFLRRWLGAEARVVQRGYTQIARGRTSLFQERGAQGRQGLSPVL